MADSKKIDRRQAIKVTAAAASVAATAISGKSAKAGEPIKNLVQIGRRTKTSFTPLKQRAANDYRTSLKAYGGQFSNPIRDLFTSAKKEDKIHFGVVVVGSGYGASIAAAKLSQKLRPDQRICMLERGKEWVPGTFPDTFANVSGDARANLLGPTKGQVTKPLGLFNLMMNDEVNILTGSGLGGGSLINASIALRPDAEVFMQQRWPMALRNVEVLGPYYDAMARSMSLSRTPFDQTPKVRSRRLAASRISSAPGFFDRSNISVMYDHRHLDQRMRNPQGMIQRPCTLCGDCINGCNIGAKNSLQYNYLPVAKHNGTEMYTQVEVTSIEKMSGYYRVHMVYIDDQYEKVTRHPVSINTKMVVLGAGSPASAGILLDSQNSQFQFSGALGTGWSGNGDTIGFAVGLEGGNNIAGYGAYDSQRPGVGPTVQTSVYMNQHEQLLRRVLIQDAAIPSGIVNLFTALMRDGDLDNSMAMLGMGHDEGIGKLVKKNGRWQISWPGLKTSDYRKMAFAEFDKLAQAHGGRYKRLKAFGNNLVTVHPLGACGMSDHPGYGSVNHLGQVYDGTGGGYMDANTGGPAVHHGLYVSDGSVVPTALGVNPYMTIGALAIRTAEHIVNNPNHADLFA